MLRIRKAPILGGALFILVFPWVTSRIPAIAHYPDLMVFAGIYALITIGLSLLMGYAGQISLGHAAFFGIGAYVSGILTTQYGFNPWLCMLLGAMASAAVAAAVGAPSLRLKATIWPWPPWPSASSSISSSGKKRAGPAARMA